MDAHCPRCAGYEDRVMRRRPGDEVPDTLRPCASYAMSDRFREWMVERLRKEVAGQVGLAGLDRVAVLRAKPAAKQPEAGEAEARPGEPLRPAQP